MQQKRYSFSVVVLDGKIYAIGGHCDNEYIESVECFCPTGNSWKYVERDILFTKTKCAICIKRFPDNHLPTR